MARQLEPWQRGYIPPVKPRKRGDVLAPEAPAGWELYTADALNWRYTYSYPWKHDYAQIIGGVGKPWKLYRGAKVFHDELLPDTSDPVMVSKDLATLARWWSVEVSLMPEPTESDNPFGGSFTTQSGRQTGKSAALGAMYGSGKTAVQIGNAVHNALAGQLLQVDFKAVEDRAAAALTHKNGAQADIYAELLKYCMADVTGGSKP